MKKRLVALALILMLAGAAQQSVRANVYDRDDSDYPLRYIAYVVYPVGMAVEYAVLRPIHRFVSLPLPSKIFGHEPNPEKKAKSAEEPSEMQTAAAPTPAVVVPAATPKPQPTPEPTTPANVKEYQDQQGGTHLEVLDQLLFAPGSATLTESGKKLLDGLMPRIKQFPAARPVMVEGHTDSDPIRFSGWPSNWDLGAARAIAVLRYLVSQGLDPARCGATTYSQYRPVGPNDTVADKAKNRRVVILILAEGAKIPASGESSSVYRLPQQQ